MCRRARLAGLVGLALALPGCFVDPGGDGSGGPATGAASASGEGSSTATATATSHASAATSGTTSTSTTDGSTSTSAGESASATTTTTTGATESTTDVSGSSDATTEPATTGSTGGSTTAPGPACGDGALDRGEGCDDGNLAAGDGCSPTCAREWRVAFASSKGYSGDLGGLDGADASCQALADEVGLPGTFRAWLSTPEGSPDTRFVKWSDRYVRVDGTPIAFDYADLVDGELLAPLNVTEQGAEIGSGLCGSGGAWTATTTAGTFLGAYCGGWKSASNLVGGAKGLVGSISKWTESGCVGACDGAGRLYCFEQ